MGAWTCFGPGTRALWDGFLANRGCCAGGHECIDPDGSHQSGANASPERTAAEFDEDSDLLEGGPASLSQDRVLSISRPAAREALSTAGIEAPLTNSRFVFGTNVGRVGRIRQCWREDAISLLMPEALGQWANHQVLAEDLEKAVGLETEALAVTGACASAALALGYAFDLVASGVCETVLAGGADEVTEFKSSGHGLLGTVSGSGAVRPFDVNRDGTLFCEGAGFLLVESLEHCLKRGHKPLALLSGYGVGTDINSLTAPDPDGTGAKIAMRAALRDAGMTAEQVDHVQAHGTATRLNDEIEARSIQEVFGAHLSDMTVSADKGAIGHTLGACGILSVILTVFMIQNGLVLPAVGCETIDPSCPIQVVTRSPIEMPVRAAMCNSFGFGGGNVAIVLRQYGEER